MKPDYEQVKSLLFSLSHEERVRLQDEVDLKIEEESFELSPAWKAEIARRLDDLRSGTVQGIPAEEVFRRVRARLSAPPQK